MKSEDQLRIGLYLMVSTVLVSLTLFWFCLLCVYFGHAHFLSNSIYIWVTVSVG